MTHDLFENILELVELVVEAKMNKGWTDYDYAILIDKLRNRLVEFK